MHFYFAYKARAECLVGTWLFWIKAGRWYWKLRVHGFEIGVGMGSN